MSREDWRVQKFEFPNGEAVTFGTDGTTVRVRSHRLQFYEGKLQEWGEGKSYEVVKLKNWECDWGTKYVEVDRPLLATIIRALALTGAICLTAALAIQVVLIFAALFGGSE